MPAPTSAPSAPPTPSASAPAAPAPQAPAPAQAGPTAPQTAPSPAPAPAAAAPSSGQAEALKRPPSKSERRQRVFAAQRQAQAGTAAPAALPPAGAPAPATLPAPPPVAQPEPASAPGAAPDLAARVRELEAENARLKAAAPAPQPPAPTQPAPDAEAKRQAAEQQRLIEDPFYAQAVGLFGAGLPEHLVTDARNALDTRAQWQRLLDHKEHGTRAKDAIRQCDQALARVRYEAEQHRERQSQAQAARGQFGAPQRLEMAGKLLASVSVNADVGAIFGDIAPGDLMAMAMAAPGETFDAWFESMCNAADARRPAATQQPAQSATAPAAASAPAPGRHVGNPAPVPPIDKPTTSTAASPWPKDRLPTRAEKHRTIYGMVRGQA